MRDALGHEVPPWVAGYVGRGFGRDTPCYELVRAVYLERLGAEALPALPGVRGRGREAVAAAIAGEVARAWEPVPEPSYVGDVAVYARGGLGHHLGVVVSRTRMLHVEDRGEGFPEATALTERFDTPTWRPRLMGHYRLRGGVRLLARANLLDGRRVDRVMAAGATLAEMTAALGFAPVPGVAAFIDGHEVPQEHWARVRPKPGRLVTLGVIPSGGDNNKTLRVVAMIAIIVVAIVAPYAAPAGAAWGVGTAGGAFVSAGIMFGGTLLLNALVPPPRPRLSSLAQLQSSPTLDAERNAIRQYRPVPFVAGKHRVFPPYAGVPVTEIVGQDQYLRLIFEIGYGPLEISELKLGETSLDNFEDLEYEIRSGYSNDAPCLIYPNTPIEQPLSLLLTQPSAAAVTGTLYATLAAGAAGWVNPANAQGAPDAALATSPTCNGANPITTRLTVTGYGAALPPSATVTGVTAVVRASATNFAGSKLNVRLSDGGSLIGTAKTFAFPSAALADRTFGGPTDRWGTPNLFPARVNTAGFGLQCWYTRVDGEPDFTGSIDSASLKFDYTVPDPASWTTRTSDTDAEELSTDLTFPQGLVEFSGGSQLQRTVNCDIEYSVAGAAAWKRINESSPEVRRQLDFLFRSSEVVLGGSGVHGARIAWGSGMPDAKPAYLPTSRYGWAADGWVFAPAAGTYTFAVDGSDAIDVTVRGVAVVSWYGQHDPLAAGGNPTFGFHAGSLDLEAGWHRVYVRMESRSANGGSLALGWKKPGDVAYVIVPLANLAPNPDGTGAGLRYRWFDNSGYGSSLTVTANSTDQIRRTKAWAVPKGQYDVRVQRTTTDSASATILDKVYWTCLRSIRLVDPIQLPNQARVALRIKATDQLNGVIEDFNCVAHSVLPDWDDPTNRWVHRATSSPAAIYRAVLQSAANKRAVADARLDLPELQAWAEDAAARGLEFNGVFDEEGTVYDRLAEVAAAGRGAFAMRNDLFSVLRDRPQVTPAQHFTPRNSRGFKGTKVYPDRPHGLRVAFLNRDKGWTRDERIVLDDGYRGADGLDTFGVAAPTLPEATLFEPLEMRGCTDAGQAWKHGRYYLLVARLRAESFEFETDIEHLICNRGDLVLCAHDVTAWGVASGRIVDRHLNGGGAVDTITVDEPVAMEAGKTYNVRIRLADNTSILKAVTFNAGPSAVLTLTVPHGPGGTLPTANDLFMFGETALETEAVVIRSITMGADLGARLTVVPHAPAVHDSDALVPPAFESGLREHGTGAGTVIGSAPPIEIPVDDPAVSPARTDETVAALNSDGSYAGRMFIALNPPSRIGPVLRAQARYRIKPGPGISTDAPWKYTEPTYALGNLVVPGVLGGATYEYCTRYIDNNGAGPWSAATEHTAAVLPATIGGGP